MHRTAIGILLIGFVFIFFRLDFAGVDLLIDAVGFLLIFNGANALRRIEGKDGNGKLFGCAVPLSVAMVATSAIQLFAGGTFATIVSVVQGLLGILLFVVFQVAFLVLLKHRNQNLLALLTSIALLFTAAVYLLGIPALLAATTPFGTLLGSFCTLSGYIAHFSTLAVFIVLFVVLGSSSKKQ